MARRLAAILIISLAVAMHAGSARGDSNLVVGLAEDSLRGRPAETMAVANDLGIRAFRLSVAWRPGMTEIDPAVRKGLDQAVIAAAGLRIVAAVYATEPGVAPNSAPEREEYCAFVRNVLATYPQINDVVIWNEPNLTYYWYPQFNGNGSASPASYHDLLARCWDVLHTFRPSVNVIGPVVSLWGNDNPDAVSNVSHAPLTFIQKLGEAYRASGRTRPIIDTFGHHPHPSRADERPWKRHESVYVSLGDWGKLMNALTEAFEGTAQPIPGQGPTIWWLEVGFQTLIDGDKVHLYRSQENWKAPVPAFAGGEPDYPPPPTDSPAPDQATQLIDSVRLSYCQPYVEAFFNFLLWDEPSLARWQSGVLWVDGSPKGSYAGFKRVIAEVNEGRVDCSRMKGGGPFIRQVARGPNTGPGPRALGANGWDDAGLLVRPRGTALPSGFFAHATPSELAYRGTRRGPFGFVTLRARLSADGRRIPGKRVSFVVGAKRYIATTDARGVATAPASPSIGAGNWRVEMNFLGDPEVRPASTAAAVEVRNSLARVVGAGELRAGKRAIGTFRVSYNGRKVKGRVRFRAPGLDFRARRLTALGVGERGRSAWFTGFSHKGKRFWAYAEDKSRAGGRDRFRLWVRGAPRVGKSGVRSGKVRITPRSSAGS